MLNFVKRCVYINQCIHSKNYFYRQIPIKKIQKVLHSFLESYFLTNEKSLQTFVTAISIFTLNLML